MIKELRKFFGIEQSLMADYLCITRSHLSMAESGHRDISVEKTLALSRFYKIMLEASSQQRAKKEEIITENEVLNAKKEKIISRELLTHRIKIQRAQRKLSKLQTEQERCLKIFEIMDQLKAVAQPGDENLLFIIEGEAKLSQNKTGDDAQLMLKMQICGLEAQINFLDNEAGKLL